MTSSPYGILKFVIRPRYCLGEGLTWFVQLRRVPKTDSGLKMTTCGGRCPSHGIEALAHRWPRRLFSSRFRNVVFHSFHSLTGPFYAVPFLYPSRSMKSVTEAQSTESKYLGLLKASESWPWLEGLLPFGHWALMVRWKDLSTWCIARRWMMDETKLRFFKDWYVGLMNM